MSAIQSTVAIVGLGVSLLCLGAEGSRDYRDGRTASTGFPTVALAIVVAIDLFGRIWR